jgi:hypothetical protein
MFGDPTDKALAMCQGREEEKGIAPFYQAIVKLDWLTRETDPEETQLVEWMCDRLNEMLFKRVERI